MSGFIRSEPKNIYFTVGVKANPYHGGLRTMIVTPTKAFTVMRKFVTETKNELTYFNTLQYITHIICPYFNHYSISN